MKLNPIMIITKFKEKFIGPGSEANINAIAVIAMALGLVAFLTQFGKSGKKIQAGNQVTESIDIFIPEGQSLVPIRVANNESLDQIIGRYGVVDLYSTPLGPGKKASRIAYKVKLVRSPGSSEHFSVLLPADQAHRITGYPGEFYVSVRNPKSVGTQFVKKKSKVTRRAIVFESE